MPRVLVLLVRLALAVGSGLLLAASFEPVGLPWLLPFAVAGFFLSVRGARSRVGFVVGLAFGISFYFTHIVWMRSSVGADAWVGLAGVEALFYAALGAILPPLSRLPLWPLWVAAAWSTMEFVRSAWPFSGMPWGRLAYAVIDTPVAPSMAYVGATGVSFGLALLGALLTWLLVARRGRHLLGVAGIVAVLAAIAVADVRPWRAGETGHLQVAAVQGNVPGPGNDVLYDHRQVTRNHAEATMKLAGDVRAGTAKAPDFVLWPENSTAVDPFEDGADNAAIVSAVQSAGVPVVVGGMVNGDATHVYNQGIVWDPATGPGQRYTKHHPVPFGEYIPFRDILNGWNFGRLAIIGRDMVAGTSKDPITVAGTKVADAICFDVAYDDVLDDQVARGARLVTVQTSNATFIFTHQIEQQFAITRLRAIETGRYVVVASTNGLSGVIAPDGHVVAKAQPRTTTVLDEQVGLLDALTPAVRMGAWPGRALSVVTIVGLVLAALTRRRRRSVGPAPQHDVPDAPDAPDAPDQEMSLT
ncbi:apolipoprotein N-acyltransferase [Nocardioides sp. CER19]|uniref:apolipoprotein N-acyltransferase n=1 Tax=Nocardioides sp. CER19 TaxID=3038538 RepID=UPI0024494490|nr:apolipoprotein N-acyltransferase [Nocardioides sp. CER19]MDH2415658.1 apolipoprotein N-acyltransferase [Nocardioides sp. CER19]